MTLVYVAVGGAMGAMLRYLATHAMHKCCGETFPYGTLAVNIAGSLAMGLLVGWLLQHPAHKDVLHPLLAVGVLGGFTTFSAFSYDAVQLMQRADILGVAIYLFTSIAGSLAALLIGLALTKAICA